MPIDWEWRLGDIYFNTAEEPDDLGCLWVIDGIPEGWDSAEFRGSASDIPFADGSDVGDGYLGGRLLHCTGMVVGPTADAVEKAKRRLRQEVGATIRDDGQFFNRPYESGLPDLYCTVRQNGKVAFPSRPGPTGVEFDFLLIAGDPHKYSVNASSQTVYSSTVVGGAPFPWNFPVNFSPDPTSEKVLSENNGDLDAPFVVTFNGPLISPTLIDRISGRRIPLRTTLPVNRSITVDTYWQTVVDDSGQFVYDLFDDDTGTPLDELVIPAADTVSGAPGTCDWLLLGRGAGNAVVTSHDAFS